VCKKKLKIMAKKDKRVSYKQRNGYDNPVNRKDPYQETEEWKLKVTEPGQAISVRKLVERYEKGRKAKYTQSGS
jgi:beta-glucosidase/6-phospho-beta-glucosidase/beta-galactosidase